MRRITNGKINQFEYGKEIIDLALHDKNGALKRVNSKINAYKRKDNLLEAKRWSYFKGWLYNKKV